MTASTSSARTAAWAISLAAALCGQVRAADSFTATVRSASSPLTLESMFCWRAGSLAVADFSGDGQIDAAVVGVYIAGVAIVGNDGSQAWVATGSWPVAVAAGDFDADGDCDLAVAEQDAGQVSILRNSGLGVMVPDGSCATGGPGPVGPQAVVAADMDKDGKPDLVVANRFARSVVVLRNTGTGFVLQQTAPVPGEPNALAVADLDNDTWLDVGVACAADDSIRILRSVDGALVPAGTFEGGPYPVAVAAADLDNDGDMDLAVADREAPEVTVLINDGSMQFADRSVQLSDPAADFAPPTDLQTADVNDNAQVDIRCGGKVLLNKGDAKFVVCDATSLLGASYGQGSVAGNPVPYLGVAYATYSSVSNVVCVAPPSVGAVPGDVDGDHHVDVVDLLYLVETFGLVLGAPGYDARCDFNHDDAVDVVDLLAFVDHWGV